MKSNLFTLFATLILSVSIFAQSDTFTTNVITKEDGIAFVNATKHQRFAFIIKGNSPSVKNLDSTAFQVTADGFALLVMFTNKSKFVDTTKENSDSAILERWRNFDIGGTESEIKEKLKVAETGTERLPVFDFRPNGKLEFVDSIYYIFPVPFPTGKYTLNMPAANGNARLYVQSMVVGDIILTVGTNYNVSEKNEKVRQFFKDMLKTLSILEPETEKKPVSPKTKPAKTKAKTKKKIS